MDCTPFIIIMIYQSGPQHMSHTLSKLTTLLESQGPFNYKTVATEDLHIHLNKSQKLTSKDLSNSLKGSTCVILLMTNTQSVRHTRQCYCLTGRAPHPGDISAEESGLSDHILIHWTISITSPLLAYKEHKTIVCRNWRNFNRDHFNCQIKSSVLCQPVNHSMSSSSSAECFQSVITNIVGNLVPMTTMTGYSQNFYL